MATKGTKTIKTTDLLIVVRLTDGLAERNRLPLSHVIKVLKEVESMINDLGCRILKERGVEDDHPNFGIELVAENGAAFTKGSVQATVAITRYAEVGMLAAREVIQTMTALSARKRGPVVERGYSQELSARVVRGLDRIAFVNETAKTRARLEIKAPMAMITAAEMTNLTSRRATLGEVAAENLRSLRSPAFEESNVRLYGKLFRLKDKPGSDDEGKVFWGELHKDSGERWRIQFKNKDLPAVTPLFTQQVLIEGTAIYYSNASPKLEADSIELDPERDLVAAYADLYGCDRSVAGEEHVNL